MRKFNNHTAVADTAPMPFDGLGVSMDSVRAAAREMSPAFSRQADSVGEVLPAPEGFRMSGGYRMLVALGREIRGR